MSVGPTVQGRSENDHCLRQIGTNLHSGEDSGMCEAGCVGSIHGKEICTAHETDSSWSTDGSIATHDHRIGLIMSVCLILSLLRVGSPGVARPRGVDVRCASASASTRKRGEAAHHRSEAGVLGRQIRTRARAARRNSSQLVVSCRDSPAERLRGKSSPEMETIDSEGRTEKGKGGSGPGVVLMRGQWCAGQDHTELVALRGYQKSMGADVLSQGSKGIFLSHVQGSAGHESGLTANCAPSVQKGREEMCFGVAPGGVAQGLVLRAMNAEGLQEEICVSSARRTVANRGRQTAIKAEKLQSGKNRICLKIPPGDAGLSAVSVLKYEGIVEENVMSKPLSVRSSQRNRASLSMPSSKVEVVKRPGNGVKRNLTFTK